MSEDAAQDDFSIDVAIALHIIPNGFILKGASDAVLAMLESHECVARLEKDAVVVTTPLPIDSSRRQRAEQLKTRDLDAPFTTTPPPLSFFTADSDGRPTWNLDRYDQPVLPLDGAPYDTQPWDGSGVDIYIVDTGLDITHPDFEKRAFHGYDFVEDDFDSSDVEGHGTHVAGIVGSTTYGVAKNARLVGVRTLDGLGSGLNSDILLGVEWVARDHQLRKVLFGFMLLIQWFVSVNCNSM
jgi:hypothetical protein